MHICGIIQSVIWKRLTSATQYILPKAFINLSMKLYSNTIKICTKSSRVPNRSTHFPRMVANNIAIKRSLP